MLLSMPSLGSLLRRFDWWPFAVHDCATEDYQSEWLVSACAHREPRRTYDPPPSDTFVEVGVVPGVMPTRSSRKQSCCDLPRQTRLKFDHLSSRVFSKLTPYRLPRVGKLPRSQFSSTLFRPGFSNDPITSECRQHADFKHPNLHRPKELNSLFALTAVVRISA